MSGAGPNDSRLRIAAAVLVVVALGLRLVIDLRVASTDVDGRRRTAAGGSIVDSDGTAASRSPVGKEVACHTSVTPHCTDLPVTSKSTDIQPDAAPGAARTKRRRILAPILTISPDRTCDIKGAGTN